MLHWLIFGIIGVVQALPAPHLNPMINDGFFEGDILRNPSWDRNAIPSDSERWPNGEIFYKISSELSSISGLIREVMDYIESETCLQFFERTTEKDYVRIVKMDGCWSAWGRVGGPQKLSLGKDCGYFGIVLHELGHAIGFEHEHNRSDRDNYLKILWENIEKKWFSAFQKLRPDEERLLSPFDYKSIMLYGSNAFVKDDKLFSMVDINGNELPDTYDRKYMSKDNLYRINKLYECDAK